MIHDYSLLSPCGAGGGRFAAERPSKRDTVKSLLSATDNETVAQDVERDYNKLARHPQGKFAC